MLYRLSDNDFQIVIESLGLTEKGTPQAKLTEDEFRNRTTFAVDGDTLVLPGGRRYGGEPDRICSYMTWQEGNSFGFNMRIVISHRQ